MTDEPNSRVKNKRENSSVDYAYRRHSNRKITPDNTPLNYMIKCAVCRRIRGDMIQGIVIQRDCVWLTHRNKSIAEILKCHLTFVSQISTRGICEQWKMSNGILKEYCRRLISFFRCVYYRHIWCVYFCRAFSFRVIFALGFFPLINGCWLSIRWLFVMNAVHQCQISSNEQQ